MKITFENFFMKTECVFKGCKPPKRAPSFISMSKYGCHISSKYWYGKDKNGEYVIRQSNHWTKLKELTKNSIFQQCESIASCQWHLKTNSVDFMTDTFVSGKAYLSNFKSI